MASSIDYFHSSDIRKVKITANILPPLVSTCKQFTFFSPLTGQIRISILVNEDLFCSGGLGSYDVNKVQIWNYRIPSRVLTRRSDTLAEGTVGNLQPHRKPNPELPAWATEGGASSWEAPLT